MVAFSDCSDLSQTNSMSTNYQLVLIGLFKMFSHWILDIFNVQIQREIGYKLM